MTVAVKSSVEIARNLYSQVFRTEFSSPGFVLLNLGRTYGSEQQRRLMVDLKRQLDELEQHHRGRRLVYQSMGRFDQQVTTKPHRDGGPDESILMLGYEPTPVRSRVSMSDYSKCAFDMGITPAEFLDQHNPMFPDGHNRLSAYTTAVDDFDHTCFQILLINNSMTDTKEGRLCGVLHTAEIINPNPNLTRIVNSTMIGSVRQNTEEAISEHEQTDFVTTTIVRKAVYHS